VTQLQSRPYLQYVRCGGRAEGAMIGVPRSMIALHLITVAYVRKRFTVP
jgi:hypothetical protein